MGRGTELVLEVSRQGCWIGRGAMPGTLRILKCVSACDPGVCVCVCTTGHLSLIATETGNSPDCLTFYVCPVCN